MVMDNCPTNLAGSFFRRQWKRCAVSWNKIWRLAECAVLYNRPSDLAKLVYSSASFIITGNHDITAAPIDTVIVLTAGSSWKAVKQCTQSSRPKLNPPSGRSLTLWLLLFSHYQKSNTNSFQILRNIMLQNFIDSFKNSIQKPLSSYMLEWTRFNISYWYARRKPRSSADTRHAWTHMLK